jgi:fatty acid desaturase
MFGQLDQKVARAGQKAALGAGAVACLAVGAGFLTVAAWIWMVAVADAFTAATVIGTVYIGAGFILLAFAMSRKAAGAAPQAAPHQTDQSATPSGAPPLMAAFIHGMQAGAQNTSK